MANFETYLRNATEDKKDWRERMNELAAQQAKTEQDVEYNAEAIAELASIIAGGE